MTVYTIAELAEILEREQVGYRTFENYELALMYTETQASQVTDLDLAYFIDWCDDRERNAQKVWASDRAEFARELYDQLHGWEDTEAYERLAPFVDWEKVWNAELRFDWNEFTNPDTGERFYWSNF